MSRFRRPGWRDPRLAVGVLLIAGSVALGAWVFAQADKTYPVYIAVGPIAVGTPVDDAAMEVEHVRLGVAAPFYLAPEARAGTDAAEPVFVEAVRPGELIPLTAVGEARDLLLRPLSLSVSHPSQIEVGNIVDLWVKEEDVTGRESSPPEHVAQGLHVTGIETDESMFAATNAQLVHVLVSDDDLEAVLASLGSRSIITLIPQAHG